MQIEDKIIKESCVETYEEAILAEKSGADRIELCAHLEKDGLTPSPELIQKVCSTLKIPVNVMIRPHQGDFIFSEQEVKQMLAQIDSAKKAGATGIVTGALTPDHQIDVRTITVLAKYSHPLTVTFHKAIDRLEDPVEGVKTLITIPGISHILTSGGETTAISGAAIIRKMIKAAESMITIVVAGKVSKSNLTEVRYLTGAKDFHGRRIVG